MVLQIDNNMVVFFFTIVGAVEHRLRQILRDGLVQKQTLVFHPIELANVVHDLLKRVLQTLSVDLYHELPAHNRAHGFLIPR